MTGNDNDRPRLADVKAAVGLLTRLPVPMRPNTSMRGGAAAWAWPLAGLTIGALGALAGSLALAVGLGAGPAAGLCILVQVVTTGAMHEDGLADVADGFWGGWTRARRLEIMKDSRIGTYGVLALVLAVLLRWLALTALFGSGQWQVVIAAATLSRAPMAVLMAALPNARGAGLSHAVGRPSAAAAGGAVALAFGLATLFLEKDVLYASLVAVLATFAVALVARSKIGGQTGDVLGAAQQVSEIAMLLMLAP
ncbi:adenosylcobinamide-GDP ribazoletransferase [Tabrizicola sp. J26]|uniref:adenosylcobinamide-GDP ribazoletransferase n=1 Tax=Alitabrizicola rongguiensis TaxID=2909234 RepID=UPI001F3886BB|nr:adenosylcobinamide-GDP ribazoletransferase [Tabrizicola rongguiensis]MCF1708994.1 adenosylcobinamide-GDP ribazoletransferase [Tabrizicola rongguiensis]